MAKYGEGDKRWIVKERPDGTNVHNWHWSETNCLEWSRTFFNNLFNNLTVVKSNSTHFIRLTKIDKLDGDAYVNIRNGKIIPGYDISLTVAWEGEVKDNNGNSLHKVYGTVEIPHISDQNAHVDPELRVTLKEEGPIGKRFKFAMLSKGRPFILKKVRVWVECMAKGGPVNEELETKKIAVVASMKEEEVKKDLKKGCKNISMTERFNCKAKDLYEILLDENRWKGFTQSNARISKEVGGEVSFFDGSVTGTNVELQEAKLIVQRWRFGSWNDGVQSLVRLVFEEPEPGITVVKLTHSDVPEEDRYGNTTVVENTERGWRDLIFQRIHAVFNFGI